MSDLLDNGFAVVEISGKYHDGVYLLHPDKTRTWVPESVILRREGESELSVREKAVVGAALKWREHWKTVPTEDFASPISKELARAADSLKDEICSNDPMFVALKALEELSKLGNGDRPGNSVGNTIARRALEDIENLRKMTLKD